MPIKPGPRASYRVEFDDALFAEDLTHASPAGRNAAEQKRAAVKQDGQSREELLGCSTEGRDGTSLPACVKAYVPWPTGRWGMVFEFRFDNDRRPYLAFLAFGVRHQPRDSNAQTVYDVARRRLTTAKSPAKPDSAGGSGDRTDRLAWTRSSKAP